MTFDPGDKKSEVLNTDISASDIAAAVELQNGVPLTTQKRDLSLTVLAISMCVLGAIFYCYEYYLRVAPAVMADELKATFHLTDAALGSLSAFYYHAYTPMQIPVGLLLDRFGPRRILTLACFLCVAGTYLFSNTDVLSLAQFGRFIIGFGSAFAYVGVLKISDSWLPKKYFALMVGIATALGMVGAMFGELSMAYMVEKMGWQATLSWSIIAGIILTVLLGLILKDYKVSNASNTHNAESNKNNLHDVLNVANENIGNKVESSNKRASTINLNHVLQGLCKIIKTPQMWVAGFIGFLLFLPIIVFAELWAVPYLQSLGFSKMDAAWGSSMVFLGFAIGGPSWGFISDKLRSRKLPLVVGSFLSALFLFACLLLPNLSAFWIYALLFLCSLAASAQVLVFAIGNDITASSITATAVAFINMIVMASGNFLQKKIGRILDSTMTLIEGIPVSGTENYGTALMIIPIGLLIAGIISLCLKESYK